MDKLMGMSKEVPSLFRKLTLFRKGTSQAVDFGQTSQVIESARLAEWYLDLATTCMEQGQEMVSGSGSETVRVYHRQCKYLVEKLETVVKDSGGKNFCASSSEHKSRCRKILKLLYWLASEVRSFVQGCCKDEGMQAALTAASVPMRVYSLAYYLGLCTLLLCYILNLEATLVTQNKLERLMAAEMAEIEGRASEDERSLLEALNSLVQSSRPSSSDGLKLATTLHKRFKASEDMLTADLPQSLNLDAWKLDGKSLLRLQELGKGSSATVHKAKWLGTVEVAEKVFHTPGDVDFEREISVLAKLSHPNIVSFLGYWSDEHSCSIVTELMDEDLSKLMSKNRGVDQAGMPFSILVACDIMLQVAEGVAYMHGKGIVHRDLKSRNVLVRRSKDDDIEYVCAKVADFGLSKTKERSYKCTHQTSNTGTNRYMAPELIEFRREEKKEKSSAHPFKSDAYSFGMVCFEILTGDVPFSSMKSDREVKEKVLKNIRPKLPRECPLELERLIKSCWDSDPEKRPDFRAICERLRCLICSLLTECHGLPEEELHELAGSPQWYLDHARECMKRVVQMTSSRNAPTEVKLYHNQCLYLADTLGTAIEVSWQLLGPLVHRVQILIHLWRVATEVEAFILDCCKDDWVKTALISVNLPAAALETVLSLGYELKSCTVLLRKSNTMEVASVSATDFESLRKAEKVKVKERASVDEVTLLDKLKYLIQSGKSSSLQFQAATRLYERLLPSKGALNGSLPQSFEIDIGALEVGQMLGRGRLVTVQKATWLGAEVATKSYIDRNNADFQNEVSILKGLCHPNIVNAFGYSQSKTEGIIVMELMDEDLSSTMYRRLASTQQGDEGPFTIDEAVDLMLQVADGVNHLHEHKIFHGKLKPSNILVRHTKATEREKDIPNLLYAKVADFGLARNVENTNSPQAYIGTGRYMAPEVTELNRDRQRSMGSLIDPFKADIYSFGMLCFGILTGRQPFENLRPMEVQARVLDGERPALPEECPQALKTLIEDCWQQNPSSRPSSIEMCQKLRYLKYSLLLPGQAQHLYQQVKPVAEPQPTPEALDFSRLSVAKIEYSRLERGIQLGKGGTETTVYEAIYRGSEGAEVRVAEKRSVTAYNEEFKREVAILADLKHSNIVSLVGYAMDRRSCSIVMELMDGDLHYLMWERKTGPTGPFSIAEAVHIMVQIAEGMDHVHGKNVVHRDLKSSNILVRGGNHGGQVDDVKVADFGLSEKLRPGSSLRFNIGTVSWMAPEVMKLKKDGEVYAGMSTRRRRRTTVSSKFVYFSNAIGNVPLMSEEEMKNYPDPLKSDVYSFGIVCFEILTGKAPTFHRKSIPGGIVFENSVKAAIFLVFLVEGLIKNKEDPLRVAGVVVVVLEGFNFKSDPQKAIVALLLLRFWFKKKKKDPIEAVKEKVLGGGRPLLPDYCPPKLRSLIERCWDKNASARPSFAQIIVDLRGAL